ncbi:hydrophobin-like protein [Xylaria arbuscula]|nr:hydrophobin-like protein [Xylaria arbuscula]
MQFSLIAITSVFAAVASANPTYGGSSYVPCPNGLYSVPQCCATDVLGVADLNCGSPSAYPSSAASFKNICAKGGQRARCCVVPVLGQDVLCSTPAGLGEQ